VGSYYLDAFESRRTSYIGIEGVTADFSAAPLTGFAPLEVQFSSVVETMEPSVSYAWDFGDGAGSSTEANPVYSYADPGLYTVILTVSADGYQDVVQKVDYIEVLELTDLIYADGFESGFGPWSGVVNPSGGLAVTPGAALFGGYGLAVTMDGVDRSGRYVVDERPIGESEYHQRFYYDPNGIVMANLDTHHFMKGVGVSGEVLRMYQYYYNGSYYLSAQAYDSGAGWRSTPGFALSDERHYIEIAWQSGASGSLELYVDGELEHSISGLANSGQTIEAVWLGPYAGLDGGTVGSYYLDAFESRRTSYIGAE
jgi:PKD repeat protein